MFEAQTSPQSRTARGIVWPFPPGLECFAAWKAALSFLVDCAIPDDADPAVFDFHGCTWQLPEAFVQINGGSAMSMARTQRVIDERPISQMSLYLLTRGSVVTDYDGHKQTHVPGDIVAVDYSLPYESQTPGYEGITVTFDRASAPAALQGIVHGVVLPANSSAGNLLGIQMRSLIDHIDGLTVDQAQSAVDGILRFAATTFPSAVPKKKRDDVSVLDRARRLAKKKISDPEFGPEDLAVALGVSRSKLFRSFEAHGGVQRWLLGERLTASLQAIVRSAGKLKISVIAHQHGFRSEAHFSRAFRKRYELSPSSALALAMRSQGTTLYLNWAKKNGKTEGSTTEAWLASALARDRKSQEESANPTR
ncbi:AraC family transcriptional regulator [Aminobacter sp. AP02]|uniref:helix-turn-helix transcriptional regulator n=1 Tax=Aminobacter sp. AP02 TaxID=2135737 RepID=UPI000D6CD3A3|nr:AraC family transcriptional regulator [Aminobacter sp. AP02]PWK68980.1 AraC family transcriptional regulator [Aminobacter sp. AP02]